jgi:hypothetical protein
MGARSKKRYASYQDGSMGSSHDCALPQSQMSQYPLVLQGDAEREEPWRVFRASH